MMLNNELINNIYKTLCINYNEDNDIDEKDDNPLEMDDSDFEASEYSSLIKIREYRLGFTNRLLYRYSKPIQDLEIFIELCKTIGNNTLNRLSTEKSKKGIALRRLHQKATLNASEIVYLIKGGYSSAAISRWRTLLETSVIAILLALNDESLSERFLDYEIVETRKEMNSYVENFKFLDFEEIADENQLEIQEKYEAIKAKYGKEFCNNYGWAAEILKNSKPNLHHLMDFTNSQYMKPFYKFSNNYVHGGPKSLLYNLGYIDGVLGDNTISSPSNIGFTDPAQLCALSYFNSTLAFLSIAPNHEDLLLILRLYLKINKIANGFLKIEEEIKQEEKEEK